MHCLARVIGKEGLPERRHVQEKENSSQQRARAQHTLGNFVKNGEEKTGCSQDIFIPCRMRFR